MINHVTVKVKDFDKEEAFYEAALAPLGYSKGPAFRAFRHSWRKTVRRCGFPPPLKAIPSRRSTWRSKPPATTP